MVVKKTEQSSKDLNDEIREVEGNKMEALAAILPTLDIPGSEDTEDLDDAEELEEIIAEEQRDLRKKQKKGQESLHSNEEDDDDEEEDDEDDSEEELIPRSKVDKRFKQMTAKIKELEAMANKAQDPRAATVSDPDQAKLDQMSYAELTKTLKDVRTKSLLLAASADPDERGQVQDYVELEMKIHQSINSYGARFYNDQVTEMEPVVASIDYDEDINDPDSAKGEIKKIAEDIYQRYPKMQTLKTGMKQAYQLAIDHYKILQDNNVGNAESKRVKRENVRLKRKTTLDTSKVKGGKKASSRKVDLLRKKIASGATDTDRTEFVKESDIFNINSLLPDQFK